jgi:hypothetical protein
MYEKPSGGTASLADSRRNRLPGTAMRILARLRHRHLRAAPERVIRHLRRAVAERSPHLADRAFRVRFISRQVEHPLREPEKRRSQIYFRARTLQICT